MQIKHYSIALLATLTLISGCKSASDTNSYADAKSISDPTQLSDAEKLAVAAVEGNKQAATMTESAQPSSQASKSRALQTESCLNDGTMEMDIPDFEHYANMTEIPDTYTFTVEMHECETEDGIEDGTMSFSMDNTGMNGSVSFLTDYHSNGNGEEIFVKKGSRFVFRTLPDGWDELVIDADITSNGIRHVGQNLIYRSKELSDGTFAEYPVSGKEQIGESALFEVDPAYDASQTPYKTDTNDKVISGKARYLDDDSHYVEIEIVAENIVAVRVDENGNNTFEEDEISTIKLP